MLPLPETAGVFVAVIFNVLLRCSLLSMLLALPACTSLTVVRINLTPQVASTHAEPENTESTESTSASNQAPQTSRPIIELLQPLFLPSPTPPKPPPKQPLRKRLRNK